MGLIATLDFFEYEYEYRDAEYEYEKKHDVLTPCQIVCDPLSQGVGSSASQKRTIEDFGATLGSGCSSYSYSAKRYSVRRGGRYSYSIGRLNCGDADRVDRSGSG